MKHPSYDEVLFEFFCIIVRQDDNEMKVTKSYRKSTIDTSLLDYIDYCGYGLLLSIRVPMIDRNMHERLAFRSKAKHALNQ